MAGGCALAGGVRARANGGVTWAVLVVMALSHGGVCKGPCAGGIQPEM